MADRWAGLAFTACTAAKDAGSVLQRAHAAMGDVTSISYSGIGMNAQFGYGMNVGEPWPRRDLAGFTRTINYDQRAMRDELAFAQALLVDNSRTSWLEATWPGTLARGPVPQLTVAEERQLHIWLTPHGFVKAAMAVADIKLSETDGRRRHHVHCARAIPGQRHDRPPRPCEQVATMVGAGPR